MLLAIACAYAICKYLDNPPTPIITMPSRQLEFEVIRLGLVDEYKAAKNEIKSNQIFEKANSDQSSYWGTEGYAIQDWHGKISSITLNNKKPADVEIDSESGVTYKQHNIPTNSGLYNQLLNLKEGDNVLFSGEFSKVLKGNKGASYQEGSLTQYGSLYNPTYGVHFSQVYLVSSSTSPNPALYAPKQSSPSDPFDQNNDSEEKSIEKVGSGIELTGTFEESIFKGTWACKDKLVAAELSDAVHHRMLLAEQLALGNECIDISDNAQVSKIMKLGSEVFIVPAGKQSVTAFKVSIKADDGSDYTYPGVYFALTKDLSNINR